MASFYWWSIEWSKKNGTEDLDSTGIIDSIDIDSFPIEELVGSLQTYEFDFPRSNKQKSIALKSVDEIDSSDYELGSADTAYLAKV